MSTDGKASDFIRDIVSEDIRGNKLADGVVTRFPPEPNGFLHIGHAKAMCVDFGIAAETGGRCHLRMDDTNPTKESVEYVESIIEDAKWLGWDWGRHLYYASDYFEKLYAFAGELIRSGKAYVCDLSAEDLRDHRGTLTEGGRKSPYRDRPAAENLDLFARMRKGEFPDGSRVLRAKIDMDSPNVHMRDPVLYRIVRATHYRAGDRWCIYPTYDFAHCLSDAIEGITHSICTLEFEIHRPLYDWILEAAGAPCRPRQIEFARLNLSYTVMSKRKLLRLVEEGKVSGWDDPRMPTICGLRRRGYTAASIREFCRRIGVTKYNGLTDIAVLEDCIRDELNKTARRAMAVLDPVRVVIDNYPRGLVEEMEAVNNPEDPAMGSRKAPFSGELLIEREDFMENPTGKFYRLAPGREVRLRYAYLVTCAGVEKNSAGEIETIHCLYDPATRGGTTPDGRKVKATIHWVSREHAAMAEVRVFDRLFLNERPEDVPEGTDFTGSLNPDSEKRTIAYIEAAFGDVSPGTRLQFERKGYFFADPADCSPGKPVFNRIVSLRDSWARMRVSGDPGQGGRPPSRA